MDLVYLVILGLTMGLIFGVALEKSKVMEPGILVGQFQFRNFTMLKMFLTATITGLVILAVLTGFGWAELHPKALVIGNVVVGGLILGAGIALAGACPGTVLAQIGVGYKDAWATILGGIAGAAFFGYFKGTFDSLLKVGNFGKITLADLMPTVPFWVLALSLAVLLLIVVAMLERYRPWYEDLTEFADDEADKRDAGPAGHHAEA